MKNKSKNRHDENYSKKDVLELEIEQHNNKTRDSKMGVVSMWNNLYKEDDRHGFLMDDNPQIKTLVDIGCGTGWFVNYANLVRKYETIYGIEPSSHAIGIGKKIYGENDIVKYINDYAEDALSNITLSDPTFFTTFIVLSHLEDETVSNILKEMGKIAPKGSIMYFNEMHGDVLHDNLWHCRTKEWWKTNLNGWELTFHTESTGFNGPNRFKGIGGIKK
jgi:SAM-dependent methyltransferase